MPDRIAALVQFLQNAPSVSAMVGQRVYAEELPDFMLPQMPKAALVLISAGGPSDIGSRSFAEYSDERIDIRHYGYTPSSARDLSVAVFPVLKGMPRTVVGDCLLHWCNPAGGPRQLREPATFMPSRLRGEVATGPARPGAPAAPDNSIEWPFVVRSWQVFASDIPVPA